MRGEHEGHEQVEFEDSAWFIGTLVAVALAASAVLVLSVWFSMLGGAAK